MSAEAISRSAQKFTPGNVAIRKVLTAGVAGKRVNVAPLVVLREQVRHIHALEVLMIADL